LGRIVIVRVTIVRHGRFLSLNQFGFGCVGLVFVDAKISPLQLRDTHRIIAGCDTQCINVTW